MSDFKITFLFSAGKTHFQDHLPTEPCTTAQANVNKIIYSVETLCANLTVTVNCALVGDAHFIQTDEDTV